MVCKSWSKSVLEYIREHPSKRPANCMQRFPEAMMMTLDQMGIFPVQFETAVGFKMFKKNMFLSKNPLPGNAVEIYLGKDEIHEYVFQGNEWFGTFGEHVLYLTFHIKMVGSNMLIIYQTLRDWINQCPNLRSISFRGSYQRNEDGYHEMNLRTLAVQVKIFGIDFGTNLETLNYDIESLPFEVSNSIFEALESSVKKLSFPLDQWNNKIDRMFTMVKDLGINNVISLIMLHDFVRANFPSKNTLQRLRLNLLITLDWTDILIILRIMRVKSLEIDRKLEHGYGYESPLLTNAFNTRMRIDTLEQLTIFDSIGLTFNFLVNFPNLKYLHVNPDNRNIMRFQELLKTAGMKFLDKAIRDALYNAIKPDFHLWLSLPSLQMLSVGTIFEDKVVSVVKYTREMFIKSRYRVVVRRV